MSATALVNFRLDTDTKQNLEEACREMGLTVSAALTLFATKVARERRIPFEITADPFYSKENLAHLDRVIADYESGKIVPEKHALLEAGE